MPVVNANARAKIIEIFFMSASNFTTFTLPEPDMALCDTQHVLEVSRARNAVEAPALGRR
jgi:hypothetical protein